MDVDFTSLFVMGLCTLGPAAITVLIFTIMRRRRGKLHRQRITSRSRKPAETEE